MLYLSTSAMPLHGSDFNIYISVILKAQPRKKWKTKSQLSIGFVQELLVRLKAKVQRDVDG